jgi:hypothetical protein
MKPGRFIFGLLALFAFCASYAVPLQPLLAGGMSCCSRTAKHCCKRNHGGSGWTAAAASCGGQCACSLPSTDGTFAISPTADGVSLAWTRIPDSQRQAGQNSKSEFTWLYQRPPPFAVA